MLPVPLSAACFFHLQWNKKCCLAQTPGIAGLLALLKSVVILSKHTRSVSQCYVSRCAKRVSIGRCRLLFRPCTEVNNLKEQVGRDTNILKVKYKQLREWDIRPVVRPVQSRNSNPRTLLSVKNVFSFCLWCNTNL